MTVMELMEALDALGSNASDLPVLLSVDKLWHAIDEVRDDEDRALLILRPLE